jgi:hypothetical protein
VRIILLILLPILWDEFFSGRHTIACPGDSTFTMEFGAYHCDDTGAVVFDPRKQLPRHIGVFVCGNLKFPGIDL